MHKSIGHEKQGCLCKSIKEKVNCWYDEIEAQSATKICQTTSYVEKEHVGNMD